MDNVAKIAQLVFEGITTIREVMAVIEAAVSAAKQVAAEGKEIDLVAIRNQRNEALDRLKSRVI